MQQNIQSPVVELFEAKDNVSQRALRQKLSAIGIGIAERFGVQPSFHEFVQQAFERSFPNLTPKPDVSDCFIGPHEKPADPSVTPEVTESTETDFQPETQSETGSGSMPDLDESSAMQPMWPSLLDAVVRRIVSQEVSDHASRQVCFYHIADAGGQPVPYRALTAEAFDAFLEELADGLSSKYTQYLERYWALPCGPTDTRTQKQWLVETRIDQLKAEVALLKADGLLNTEGVTLFNTVLRYPQAQARQALRGYRPCVCEVVLKDGDAGRISLHGAFILTAREPGDADVKWESEAAAPVIRPVQPTDNLGLALLFTPNGGLEAFDSLASLDRELHRRLSHADEFSTLMALAPEKDQARLLALHRKAPWRDQVKYLERLDSPFDHGIESQCMLIRENLESTLALYVAQGVHANMANMPRVIDRVTDLHKAFDVQAILMARLRKRARARLATFLKDVTQADKDAWLIAFSNYTEALVHLPDPEGLPSLAQFSDRRQLLVYANRQLRIALKAEHGLTVNPDDILVHTKEPDIPPTLPGGHGPVIHEPGEYRYKHRQRTLTELALDNLGSLDFNFTHFSRLTLKIQHNQASDKTKSPQNPSVTGQSAPYEELTLQQVKSLVRTVNVGQRYQDFLKASLITSPEAALRKQSFARVMEWQLRLDAIEARLNGDFLSDRLARGFNWVQVVLDEPEDNDRRKKVEGHRIMVQHLKLRGQRVRGVLLFGTASSAGSSIVVYTPQAPDGRVFHEFVRERLMADFVHDSSWREYLVERVERAFQPHVRATLKGRGDVSTVSTARIADNLFEEAYEVQANFAINDAAAQSTTTGQTDIETGLSIATTVFDVLTFVLPVQVTLPVGIARSLIAIFDAAEAAQRGDPVGAAYNVVRALAEFTGVLVDGAIGANRIAGAAGSAAKARADVRSLNPQMALKKKPEGLLPLKGWEGKGVYYRLPRDGGGKDYFLNDRSHWYSILDEGFEEAWRVRDVRKPVQKHYSPIRRDAAGQWEIGTHPDAPALGGISPESALRDLYPFLDEAQVRHVFEALSFPPGRETELGLSLVQHLREGRVLDTFMPYMRVSVGDFRRRLSGVRSHLLFSGGGIVEVTPGPSRPVLPEPIPGPSRPAPPRPTPPGRARSPSERYLDWDQVVDASELELVDESLKIYRHVTGDEQLIGREYIKFGDRYAPILPRGRAAARDRALIYNPEKPIGSFEQFEHMLWTDLFDQPRFAHFADGLWIHTLELPFEKTFTAYVADGFPTFTGTTQTLIANTLFHRTNPAGPTVFGLGMLKQSLQAWRLQSVRAAAVGDPLSLLPVTPRVGGNWLFGSAFGPFKCVFLRTRDVWLTFHLALTSGTEQSLRTLMVERLTGSHYEVVPGLSLVSEVVFRRPGGAQIYWLSLRRVVGDVIDGSRYVEPAASVMDSATRSLVDQARATHNFVPLIGGIRLSAEGAAAELFIIRI